MQDEDEAVVQEGQIYNQVKLRRTFELDLMDYFLWCTILVIFIDPFLRPLVGGYESQHRVMSRFMRKDVAFFIQCLVSYSYSFFTFILFNKCVSLQPRIRDLQRNEALLIGYMFVLTGIFIKVHTYINNKMATIMGGHYFGIEIVPRKIGHMLYDPYYHPLGTSSVVCYFGFSIVRASAAGVILTATLGIAYYAASHLERYYLIRLKKQKLEQYTFTPISCPVGNQRESEGKVD